MNKHIKNYISDNDIFVNNLGTYNTNLKNYVDSNIKVISTYKKYSKFVNKCGLYKNNYKAYDRIQLLKNKFKNDIKLFDDLVNEVCEMIENCWFIIYHLTRLTDFECNKIEREGLSPTTKNSMIKKINDLNLDNVYKDFLINGISNKLTLKDENLIYMKIGTYSVNRKGANTDLKVFLTKWGGECISDLYIDSNDSRAAYIKSYLNEHTNPKLVICRIKGRYINELSSVVKKILLNYPLSLYKVEETLYFNSVNFEVVKILDFNVIDKMYY